MTKTIRATKTMKVTKTMRKAILTMGLPASGKSTTLNNTVNINEYKLIDPDIIKQSHPDYDPKKPQLVHAWSQTETKKVFNSTVEEGTSLIVDGTGTDVVKMRNYINALRKGGYMVQLFYCKVSLETAIDRNSKRERTVPQDIIMKKYDSINEAFDVLSGLVDKVTVVNND